MDEFLKMDIFFAVTTLAVITLTVLVAAVLVRIFRILRIVEEVSTLVSEEGKELRADIAQVRTQVAERGLILGGFDMVSRAFTKRVAPRRKRDSQ